MTNNIEFRGYILPSDLSVKNDEIRDATGTLWTLALGWEGKIVLWSTQNEFRAVRPAPYEAW